MLLPLRTSQFMIIFLSREAINSDQVSKTFAPDLASFCRLSYLLRLKPAIETFIVVFRCGRELKF